MGYSPWGRKESDKTERLSTHTPDLDKDLSHCKILSSLFWTEFASVKLAPSPIGPLTLAPIKSL